MADKKDKIKEALDEVAQYTGDVAPILRINTALELLKLREFERIANALEKIAGKK